MGRASAASIHLAPMRGRPLATAAIGLACLLGLVLLVAWLERFRVATALVDRRLAAAGVPASYRITRIGPFRERMENVRIGDPAAPDLVARRIDVSVGYGLSGPVVQTVRIEGVRLRGQAGPVGLSFGAIDRLLPKGGGGKPQLPDIGLVLRDTQLMLDTPYGAALIAMEGNGNPTRRFAGRAQIAASRIRLSNCTVQGMAADLRVEARDRRPEVRGPVNARTIACPGIALGAGRAGIAVAADAAMERFTLRAHFDGFGGRAATARFGALHGSTEAAGSNGDLRAKARVGVAALSIPSAADQAAGTIDAAKGTPLAPTAKRAMGAFARLLRDAAGQAILSATVAGDRTELRLKRLELNGRDGARLTAIERGGLVWASGTWRTDADIAMGGGELPEMRAQIRQAQPSGPVVATVQLAPYRADDARLAATTPLRLTWNGTKADFATIVEVDGRVANGFVRGLTIPIRGHITAGGAVVVGDGCTTLGFRTLRLSSFTFDAARLPLCGRPIVARPAEGALRIAATAGPIALTGRTADGAPVAIDAAGLRFSGMQLAAQGIALRLGAPDRQTRLAIGTLDGAIGHGVIAGGFAQASGGIGNVPLDIADANGRWRIENSALRLAGDLRVSDAASAARFNPLVTDDAVLTLVNSAIRADASLREPASRALVTKVEIEHDLSRGSGHALLNVPGIAFAPKGLQPEKLTPLTLGVIANVAGTVSGSGRIDWSPAGVASSGTFGTERIDLAAAFGPVTGLRGQVHFTDLLGLVSAPAQEATIAEINPGVAVTSGVIHYQLIGGNRIRVEDARWPFAAGTLSLEPTMLNFSQAAERHLTFRVTNLDAATFIQQLDFPNIATTGRFDGVLPMIFDQSGGRIEGGSIGAQGGGTLAYVGQLTTAQLGATGKLAFDALKAIRYSSLEISLDGRLDGEMISRVRFQGIREATPEQSLVTRMIRNLPFRFNIEIRAPFRSLVGSARAYMDPRLLLTQPAAAASPAGVQPPASGSVR